jgi:hypothetical protein
MDTGSMTLSRKRLLIALAAVLTLSASYWLLTRPVIDPRLVGTWEVATSISFIPGTPYSEFLPLQTIELHDDGTAVCHHFKGPTTSTIWRTDGDRVVLGVIQGQSSLGARVQAYLMIHVFSGLASVKPSLHGRVFAFPRDGSDMLISAPHKNSPVGMARTRIRRVAGVRAGRSGSFCVSPDTGERFWSVRLIAST